MGLLSWFKGRKAEPIVFDPETTVEQQNEILAAKLDSKGQIECAVRDILIWAQDARAKDKSRMIVWDFGFDKYGAHVTPMQEGIVKRLNELGIQAKIVSHQRDVFSRGDSDSRHLLVEW